MESYETLSNDLIFDDNKVDEFIRLLKEIEKDGETKKIIDLYDNILIINLVKKNIPKRLLDRTKEKKERAINSTYSSISVKGESFDIILDKNLVSAWIVQLNRLKCEREDEEVKDLNKNHLFFIWVDPTYPSFKLDYMLKKMTESEQLIFLEDLIYTKKEHSTQVLLPYFDVTLKNDLIDKFEKIVSNIELPYKFELGYVKKLLDIYKKMETKKLSVDKFKNYIEKYNLDFSYTCKDMGFFKMIKHSRDSSTFWKNCAKNKKISQ